MSRLTTTRLNSILYNGNFEIAPSVLTAQTNTAGRWIDGTAAGSVAKLGLGWAAATSGVTASAAAGFDNTVSHSGTYSMKLSTLNASGAITVSNLAGSIGVGTLYQIFMLPPNISVTLSCYIKTNNVASNSAFIDLRQYNTAATALATTPTTKVSGTADWTVCTVTVTTNASCVFGALFLRNNVAGNVGDAWFDDITLVSNSLGRIAASGRSAATGRVSV